MDRRGLDNCTYGCPQLCRKVESVGVIESQGSEMPHTPAARPTDRDGAEPKAEEAYGPLVSRAGSWSPARVRVTDRRLTK
uniref:Uncharacterized protein n=1 Tax=Knipowitschia caucasica TaxID=637954 RepID=A0AAV2KL40_KNICA